MLPNSIISINQGELYAGYACAETIRVFASSGGVVSCILINLLESGQINGALVSRITSQDGHVCGVTKIVQTTEEILQHAGSSYIDTPVVQSIKKLKNFSGRVAIVALPCQTRLLKVMMKRNAILREKIFLVIGLFCRGNVKPIFYDDYFKRCSIDFTQVESVKVSRKHLRGNMSVKLRNGIERHIPFMSINAYRQAGIHAKDLCAWCYEHTAEDADLSVGDIFIPEFKQKPIKRSAFIAHSDKAATLLGNMQSEGILTCQYVGIERYKKSFAKVEQFSNSLSPRYAAARLIGLKFLKSTQKIDNFNLFHFMAWTIIFLNKKISLTRWGRRFLYALPSLFIYLVSVLVKGLSRM